MKGKTHIILGAAAGITFASKYSIEQQVIFFTFTTLGSLFPDIDHPKSTINQKLLLINNNSFKEIFYLSLGLGSIYYSYMSNIRAFNIIGIALILTSVSRHRGFNHSLLGLYICMKGMYYISNLSHSLRNAHLGFTIGYISHLIADMMTDKGIQLFYPLKVRIKFPFTFNTDGIGEYVIMILASIYFVNELVKFFIYQM